MKTYPGAGRSGIAGVAVLACLVMLTAISTRAASIVEPATVFYGTVTGTGSEQPFAVTEGALVWTLRRADGVEVVLSTGLFPLNGGAISYYLEVPHEAWGLGLTGSTSSIPLAAAMATNVSVRVTVNGVTARIVPPATDVFAAGQITRAATYRMDLEVPLVAEDSDGDGMPDWWENRYGLDSQNSADAASDADGDGLANLQEYRGATDPKRDDRVPELLPATLRAYAGGATLVRLNPRDIDTAPSALAYTLMSAPSEGRLVLRNGSAAGSGSDVVLGTGSVFSQADVASGRLVYECPASVPAAGETRFELRLQDENLAHPAALAMITLALYVPPADAEIPDCSPLATGASFRLPVMEGIAVEDQLLMEASWLSRTLGAVIWDASSETRALTAMTPSSGVDPVTYVNQYVPQYGADRHHILWGGKGNDRLSGGMEGDILIGGPGDDVLRGNGGADLFVVVSAADGDDIIDDFSVADHDVLDLSRLLGGTPGWLTNYVHLAAAGTNTLLGVNLTGGGSGFTNVVITLTGVSWSQGLLAPLVENGNLLCGGKVLVPRVSVAATIPAASENGPSGGEFTVTRTGGVESDLAVTFTVSGSAINGEDYVLITSPVIIPAGLSSVTLPVEPYVDTLSEAKEVVQVNITAGVGYEIGSGVAQVTIDDLAPLITIEALDPVAVKSTLTPGVFLISRSGIVNRSVLVRLVIGGTATSGADYSGVPTYVNLASEQTTALITVTPKAGASLANGAESVDVSIRPDSTYCLGSPSMARITLVDELLTLAAWKTRNFSVSAMDMQAFAQDDPGAMGIRNIQRYAFGLDPVDPRTSFGKPMYTLDRNRLSVTFRRPLSVTDVDYIPEVSRDLISWSSGSNAFEGFIHPDYTGRLDMVSYRVLQPLTNSVPIFMRVRLDYNP